MAGESFGGGASVGGQPEGGFVTIVGGGTVLGGGSGSGVGEQLVGGRGGAPIVSIDSFRLLTRGREGDWIPPIPPAFIPKALTPNDYPSEVRWPGLALVPGRLQRLERFNQGAVTPMARFYTNNLPQLWLVTRPEFTSLPTTLGQKAAEIRTRQTELKASVTTLEGTVRSLSQQSQSALADVAASAGSSVSESYDYIQQLKQARLDAAAASDLLRVRTALAGDGSDPTEANTRSNNLRFLTDAGTTPLLVQLADLIKTRSLATRTDVETRLTEVLAADNPATRITGDRIGANQWLKEQFDRISDNDGRLGTLLNEHLPNLVGRLTSAEGLMGRVAGGGNIGGGLLAFFRALASGSQGLGGFRERLATLAGQIEAMPNFENLGDEGALLGHTDGLVKGTGLGLVTHLGGIFSGGGEVFRMGMGGA